MKCMKCGNEVEIGEVYCQTCGTAIQIVPVYSPLEDEIESVVEFQRIQEEKEAAEKQRLHQCKLRKRKSLILCSILMTVLVVAVVTAINIIPAEINRDSNSDKNDNKNEEEHTFDYQYAKASEYLLTEEYSLALQYFDHALEYDPENMEVRMIKADIYRITKEYDHEVEQWLDIVDRVPSLENYKNLMEACEYAGNTQLMYQILTENKGNFIEKGLTKYQVDKVMVNTPAGYYQDFITLELSVSQKDAVIYYTLDGQEPTEKSEPYTEPIELNSIGTTHLRAVAYNKLHIAGEELDVSYSITLSNPSPPNIYPVSGSYEYGEKIEISVPSGGTAYFTIDGSMPKIENAYRYTDLVSMPIGNTIFSAIVVDQYGMVSDVSKRNYTSSINRPFRYEAAVIKLKSYLVETGMMNDLSGLRSTGEKISIEFKSLFVIGEVECYIFTLHHLAGGEDIELVDNAYAITTQTGELYPLIVGADNSYSINQ